MGKLERFFVVAVMIFLAVVAVECIGKELHALLAIFEVAVGIIIGMTIFMPNKNT